MVRRQHETDVARLLPTITPLTERQQQLFFLFQSVIARHRPEGLARLVDDDVADAAGTLAATLETAEKGVIYQHATQSGVARRLATELKTLLDQIRNEGATVYDREAAMTLRAIEQGAKSIRGSAERDDEYLTLMGRLLQVNRAEPGPVAPGSPIILP